MNTQEKLDSISEQVDSLNRKYGERSISPGQDSGRHYPKRIKSSGQSLKLLKPQQQNFLKGSKETQGGGFYKRSQIMATSFPVIKKQPQTNQQTKKVEESISLAQIDPVTGIKQFLGPNHHCHFEIQVKQLIAKLEVSEQLTLRAKEELDNVIWMVKNYNSDGLISRLLQLQQLKNELEKDSQLMRDEIEMLGLQRDDWQTKYQEIYEKLLKMQGIEDDLHDALHKLSMSNESLEQINRRLREKQLEVQDWQRKCNTHDEQFKIRIQSLEETLKDRDTQILMFTKKIQQLESENHSLELELKNKSEKFEEEQRKSRQLNAELLDTKVNKVQVLQDEISKQKKIIQQKNDDFEEQEKKIKSLNNKVNLLETQLKNFDDVARQEKEELEKGWQKKYKELEKQNVQYKRDLNQLEIQLQQVDLLIQQKEQEVEQSIIKIKELTLQTEKQLEEIKSNKMEIHKLTQELSERDQELEYLEKQQEEAQKERTEMLEKITQQNEEINSLKQQSLNYKKEAEGLRWEKQDQERKIQQLNEQIQQANQSSERYRQQLDEEVKKTYSLMSDINKLKEEFENQKEQNQQKIKEYENQIKQKEIQMAQLQEKLLEFQNSDKNLSDKLQKVMSDNQKLENDIQNLKKEKDDQNQKIEQLKSQISNSAVQAKEFEKEKQQLLKKIEEVQNDRTEIDKLNIEITQLKQELENKNDYDELKNKASQIETIYDEKISLEQQNQQLSNELNLKKNEVEDLKQKYNTLEYQKKNLESQLQQVKEKNQQTQEIQLQQISQLQKKLLHVNEELQRALDKIEILEEALSTQNSNIKIVPKQAQIPLQKNNTFQQIFVEEKNFSNNPGEEILLKFAEIDFSRNKGHLAICFWVKIDQTNSKEMMPLMRINSDNKILLELGVYLDTKQVYSTFIPNNHPKNKKPSNPLTVTSQLSIKLGQFQLMALIMTESGQYMDMGLCLNGVRDDQVSISTSLIFPEAQLTFGKYTNHHLILKDCLVITENLQRFNVFKEVYQTFYQKYNGIKQTVRKYKQKKDAISYLSAGDLIFYLIQQYEQSPPKSGSRSKSPPNSQAVIINNRTVPAGLVSQYELLNTQAKTEETKPDIIEQPQWSRKYAIEKLKKFLYSNFNYKGLMRPFIESYDYISLGLQLLEPQRMDENPTTKFHKIIKPKIIITPFYIISYKQFINYLQYVGLLRITLDEFQELCELMEVIYTIGKEQYIHYDHFLIVLRECIMNRADLKKQKQKEKGELSQPQFEEAYNQTYKEIVIKSTGIEEQEVELSNGQGIMEICFNINEGKLQYQIKLDDGSVKTNQTESFPNAVIGSLEIKGINKVDFIFSNQGNLMSIKTEKGSLIIGEQSDITIVHTVEIEDNQDFVKFNLSEKCMRLCVRTSIKFMKEIPIYEEDPELELENLTLVPVPEGWNLGKFYVNINRCKNCDQHQSTTRHQENDFIQKTEYVINLLKEIFPNVEILENEEKSDKLENFEVYVKNALGPSKMMLLQKQENMNHFLKNFDHKLPHMYEKLMLIVGFHNGTDHLGLEQEKYK